MSNYCSGDYNLKLKFVFELYDEDKNGFLVMDELIKVLKANHLVSDNAAVARKAATIMKQVDKDGDNRLNMEEFQVIAQKFPNIMFPSTGKK